MNRRAFLLNTFRLGGAVACASFGFLPKEIAWANAALIGEESNVGAYVLKQDLPVTPDTGATRAWGSAAEDHLIAGRFVASSTYTLRKVGFYVSSIAGTPTFTSTCEIYSSSGLDAFEDTPDASLATSTNSITSYAATTWIEFLFAGLSLTNATAYWAVAKMTAEHDGINYVNLGYDSEQVGARLMRSDHSPVSWVNLDTSAQLFLRLYS